MEAGTTVEDLAFSPPVLAGWRFPVARLTGAAPGPHLAVIAGVHVNETSSIEAAIRLQRAIAPAALRGRISVIPILNQPAIASRTQYVCPIDGKNINFSFPGAPDGSFSEALAWAVLNEFAADADVLVDLHGGDLCEEVSHFTIAQGIGDPAFDAESLALARCFDAEIVVRLGPEHLEAPGRSTTGRATQGRHAAFAEAGRIGLIEAENVRFHLEGVLRIAHRLGMIGAAPPLTRTPVIADRYLWIDAPADAIYRPRVEPGEAVAAGAILATAEDAFGREIAAVTAPESGWILWRITHALVADGGPLMGLAVAG
ncbi:MAG TPA: succinylglutamate desuccinylase/aspartoacylase family protein [Amaricoccus sp.]|nr:succinylglutamate desuccinylase/aspartoacylase family protein [Amaricoccus sp.]